MHSTLRFTLFRALLLLFYAAMSTACTEAIINDPCSNAVVSSRTMSFDAELSPRVTAGKPLRNVATAAAASTIHPKCSS